MVVFPIDLNCENEKDTLEETRWKRTAKSGLGGDVLLAFAYGFPGSDSKVMVKYRANKVMIEQLTAGIEIDDEDEGVDDTDD